MNEQRENAVPLEISEQEKKRERATFTSDVLKLLTGTAFVQFLSFASSLLLARLFAPDAFGVSVLFNSITTIIMVVATLRYEMSIMLPKSDEESANQLAVTFFFLILSSIATAIIFWSGQNIIIGWLKAPDLRSSLWMVAPAVLFNSAILVLNTWNTRYRRFTITSIGKVVNEGVTDGARITSGLAGWVSGQSLIANSLIGSIISALYFAVDIWRNDLSLLLRSIRWNLMVAGMKRYKKFPLYNITSALLSTLSLQLPAMLLSAYFSPSITGFYGMGQRVLRFPITLISGAVADVFYQRSAKAMHEGTLAKLVEETFSRLLVFGMFPMLIITLAGKELFILFFGVKWTEAGVYSEVLGIWTFFLLLSGPLLSLVSLFERQEVSLWLNIFIFVTRIISLLIGGLKNDIILGLILFNISGIVAYGWFVLWVTKKAGISIQRTLTRLWNNLFFSLPFLIGVGLVKWLLHGSPLGVTVACALAAVLYYSIAFYRDRALHETIELIVRKFLNTRRA